MTFEEVRRQLNAGRRMSRGEYAYLDELVWQDGIVIDIGAWMGFSTRVLAEALIKKQLDGSVIAIDPHTLETAGKHRQVVKGLGLTSTLPFLEANLKEWGIEHRVSVIAGRSQNPRLAGDLAGHVSLVVIDGSHRHADVISDFKTWYPAVREGGYIAFHDYRHIPGPTKAVDEVVRPLCTEVGLVGWLIVFQK